MVAGGGKTRGVVERAGRINGVMLNGSMVDRLVEEGRVVDGIMWVLVSGNWEWGLVGENSIGARCL
jgi:hypothetical protein